MGALTSNRKRGDFTFSSKSPISNSPHFQVSKKPMFSPMHLNPERLVSSSSKSVATKIALYPQQIVRLRREVHAPCRVTKFRRPASVNRVSQPENPAPAMGNILKSQYRKAKSIALDTLRYFKKDKEFVDVSYDSSDDSSIEEIEIVDVGREEKSREIQFGSFKPSSGNSNWSLDNRGMNLGVSAHKKLYESAERRNPKLGSLSFEIGFTEKRLAEIQSRRPVKKQEEVVPREPFVALSKAEEAEISGALSSSSRRKVLVTHENSNIEITGQVLQCLRPGAWLNDEVINVYLELLKERETREPNKFLKCHFFNTFFYKKLNGRTGYEFKSVRRWTSQRKLGYFLLDCDKIFVPIHKEVHWCLAVINKKEQKFQYLDSLGGRDNRVLKILAKYIVDEVKDKSGKDVDVSSWKEEFVEDLPAQENMYDCGVFMIKYADFYSRGLGLCFKQEHMPYFRLRTAKEILRLKAE